MRKQTCLETYLQGVSNPKYVPPTLYKQPQHVCVKEFNKIKVQENYKDFTDMTEENMRNNITPR